MQDNDPGNETYEEASASAYIARAKAHAARKAAEEQAAVSALCSKTLGLAQCASLEWIGAELRATRILEEEQLA